MQRSPAFTILEIIVTISIVGVLAILAVQTLNRAKVSGQRVQCASNLRQIGAALPLYAAEHEDTFPSSAHTDARKSWIYTLQPYLNEVDEVRICPADPQAEARLQAGLSSYLLNEFICVPLRTPFGKIKEDFTRRSSITSPARTITVFTGADGLDVGISSDHTHSRNWKSWAAVLADIQPDRFRSGDPAPDRTKGNANYLYADGHVEAHDAAWLILEILARRNPARPPE